VHIDHIESKKEEKRRKKAGQVEEQYDEKDKLERPEHAMSYQEYLAELKRKNESLNETKGKEPPHEVIKQDVLKVHLKESEDVQYQNFLNEQKIKKKKEKVKERRPDQQEEQLNRLIADNLTLSNQEKKFDKSRYDKSKDYQYNKGSDNKMPRQENAYRNDKLPQKQ
jgi:hypothetical protein